MDERHDALLNRREFLLRSSALAGSGIFAFSSPAYAEPPSETTRIRLPNTPAVCLAPQYIAEPLLKAEGFTDIQYVHMDSPDPNTAVASGKADITMDAVWSFIARLDQGAPVVMLAGVHLGCYELFGNERVRSIRDLKGKRVAVTGVGDPGYLLVASMAAYVGLDPEKDIRWVIDPNAAKLFAEGKVDACMAFPPEPQELRGNGIGHVVVNTATDKPWSQYYCCMASANQRFVRDYPVATKRALRAILKAADICSADPARAARMVVERRFTSKYEYALQALKDVPYNAWRTYDPDTTLRFYALRLHEVGLIKASPQRILAEGTDWRFLQQLRKELKA